MSDIIDVQTNEQKAEGLKTIGWISYALHLIVAVGAVLPGAQAGALLLIIALLIDLIKRSDAESTWQANHFFVAHSLCDLGGGSVCGDDTAVVAVHLAGLDCVGLDLVVVPVPHRARHAGHEQQPGGRCLRRANPACA